MDVATSDAAFDALEIMERLDHGSRTREFPSEAIAIAREHREQMISALLQCLEEAVDLATDGEEHDSPVLLALCLLTEFRAAEAWPLVRRMLLLPGEGPFDVVGDGIHEIVPDSIALLALCTPGGMDEVIQLAQSPDIDLYCRTAVAASVCRAYSRDVIDHDSMVSAARQLLSAIDADHPEGDEYRAHFIASLLDSHCAELRQEIEDLYAREMVDDWIVSFENVQSTFDGDKESAVRKFHDRLVPLDVFTDQLRHWAAFQKPDKRPAKPLYKSSAADSSPGPNTTNPQRVPDPDRQTITNTRPKIGRNEPCPCGSGKKL